MPIRSRHPALPPILALALVLAACGEPASDPAQEGVEFAGDSAPAGAAGAEIVVEEGLDAPESALHDPVADVYLVANIAGEPTAKDGNGFIARVGPDGSVEAARWIAGGAGGVTLHAPKGMGIRGDTLFVADVDVVRLFHRAGGEPLGEWAVPGATFLNDVSVGPEGTVYVSDSAMGGGTPAVYRFDAAGAPTAISQGAALQGPNGLLAAEDGVYAVTFGSNQVLRLPGSAAQPGMIARVPGGQLDGIVQLPDGSFLVSSWETSAVYRVDAAGEASVVVEGVAGPADIGYDAARGRVLIPQLTENRLLVRGVE